MCCEIFGEVPPSGPPGRPPDDRLGGTNSGRVRLRRFHESPSRVLVGTLRGGRVMCELPHRRNGRPVGSGRVTIDLADGLDQCGSVAAPGQFRRYRPASFYLFPAIASRRWPSARGWVPSRAGDRSDIIGASPLSARPRASSQRPGRLFDLPWRSGPDGRPRTAWRLFPLRRHRAAEVVPPPADVGRQDQPGYTRQRAQDQCGAERDQSSDGYRHHGLGSPVRCWR